MHCLEVMMKLFNCVQDDPASLLVQGGWNGANWLSDPWSYEVPYKEWQQLNISPAPMARSQHVAVWDKAGQRVWLHGGYGTGLFGDLWTLGRGRSSVWAEVTFAGGPHSEIGPCSGLG